MDSFMVSAVALPVVAGIFKNEISNLFKALDAYTSRPFDTDRNPDTPEVCELLNGATGQWGKIEIERYKMSLSKSKRGVFIKYPGGQQEKISLVAWAKMRKRSIA